MGSAFSADPASPNRHTTVDYTLHYTFRVDAPGATKIDTMLITTGTITMISANGNKATMNCPAVYRLRVQGLVPLDWSVRLMGMNITTSDDAGNDQSTLVGRLPDQAALSGVLNTLYDSQFPVLSVECLEVG
jgi:hypothetical protein